MLEGIKGELTNLIIHILEFLETPSSVSFLCGDHIQCEKVAVLRSSLALGTQIISCILITRFIEQ